MSNLIFRFSVRQTLLPTGFRVGTTRWICGRFNARRLVGRHTPNDLSQLVSECRLLGQTRVDASGQVGDAARAGQTKLAGQLTKRRLGITPAESRRHLSMGASKPATRGRFKTSHNS